MELSFLPPDLFKGGCPLGLANKALGSQGDLAVEIDGAIPAFPEASVKSTITYILSSMRSTSMKAGGIKSKVLSTAGRRGRGNLAQSLRKYEISPRG